MLRGEILVGRLVFLAVLRHYEDLRDGAARGIYFSPRHAWHVISYIQDFFVHTKGPKAGQALTLDPWQTFWTAVLYGWLRSADGMRRFSRGLEGVGRKNGKSTWKAPQGAYLFMMDGEIGAEVYAVATTRGQAMTVFKPAFENIKRWRRKSRGAERSFKISNASNQESVTLLGDIGESVFKPIASLADNMDGLNPHAVLFDELHAQKSRDVWDVLESAFGARSQPLLSAITTAGYILDGVCTELLAYLVSVLRGEREDDAFFGYFYTLDPDDSPFDEKVWPKANPSLGSAKSLEYMRTQARKASALPSALVNFKTKDLNIFCGAAEGWMDIAVWDKCGGRVDIEQLRGRRCFGGLDLAATTDLIAFALLFPPLDDGDGRWDLIVRFWAPEMKVQLQEEDDAAPYRRWADEGWLTVTPGNVNDYDSVKTEILAAKAQFEIVELGFDNWNALEVSNKMIEQGVPMVDIPQNTGGMYPGSKLLELLVYSGRLRHGGNPVLRYCIDNTALLHDSNGNFRPDKRKSRVNGRIDGTVATVMAASRAVVSVPEMSIDDFINSPVIA